MQTPKLCIDGRAAEEFSSQGYVAQELIDQLVAARGEAESSEWIEKQSTVLLSHPRQVFSGQLKRFDTKRKIGSTFFYWAWEKHFVENAGLAGFHRFRPADRLEPKLPCNTITTVLPAHRTVPKTKISTSTDELYVVASETDRETLQSHMQIPRAQTQVVIPTVRRFVHFTDTHRPQIDGQVLFLVDGTREINLKKLQKVISTHYPQLKLRTLQLRSTHDFSPQVWTKMLRFCSLCFYLTERPFDWPFLALEALYFGVPTIFMDNHPALRELFPQSPLRLSTYLTELRTASQFKNAVNDAKEIAKNQGAFDALGFADRYRQMYERFSGQHSIEV